MKILFVIFLSHSAVAANLDDIKALLSSTYADNRPGASVIIVDNGEIMHEAGYGLANVEHGIPIMPETIFRVGSITKQFTAAAIMLLQQRGELSVDDPIEKYLPDYPTHGHKITIYHLLNHTSGINLSHCSYDDLCTDLYFGEMDTISLKQMTIDDSIPTNDGFRANLDHETVVHTWGVDLRTFANFAPHHSIVNVRDERRHHPFQRWQRESMEQSQKAPANTQPTFNRCLCFL